MNKTYNEYLETLNKMKEVGEMLKSLDGKKWRELTDKQKHFIENFNACEGYYDKNSNISDVYYINDDDVFDLFHDMKDNSVIYLFSREDVSFGFSLYIKYYEIGRKIVE